MMLVSDDVTMYSLATTFCSTVGLDLVKRTLQETVILPSLRPEVCNVVSVRLFVCMCVCTCIPYKQKY